MPAIGGGHRRRWLIPASSILSIAEQEISEDLIRLDLLTDQKIIAQVQEIRAEALRLAEKASVLEKMLIARYK